ncbi:MAG: RpiR family transcriptional regulator, partial [Hamadaea sp.]|nr:RpiR family transcriptional regulator [Hamadaea sp.]NUT04797.1 RpiR family transcriptional regulator [Hamadaea sp.]
MDREVTVSAAHDDADALLPLIQVRLTEFTGALRRVADHVLADPAAAARATIVELA